MGKKRVIKKTEEELIQEKETVEQKLKKEIKIKAPQKLKRGRIYISSTYNNTIITLTDESGNVLLWRSAGNIGFKGTKKGTSYAASRVAQSVALACEKLKIKNVDVFVKGVGGGRDTALKTLVNYGLELDSITDVTPLPHNGCRPRKPRRV
jgi:small subunit ribosomal protein S11